MSITDISIVHFFILYVLIFSSIALLIVVLTKYIKAKKTLKTYQKMFKSVLKTVNSVRYGNIYERVDKELFKNHKDIEKIVNSMLDSIVDREGMIKEYQNDLNKKIEALKEIEQLKEDFVATLTHDLKVPILAEKNMLNFLSENRFGELNDRQKEAIFHLQNSNKELVELVEIILETYKLNEAKIELNKEEIDINKLVTATIDEMRPISDTDNINLRFYSDCDEKIFVDEFYIKRVLKNLILNAISFSNPHSDLDIYIGCDEKNVYIKITNYGKCVKKEEMKHVFDKYYTTAKKFRKVGTGLGLYLSNKIIKEHKGKITIDSKENEFTTFTIV